MCLDLGAHNKSGCSVEGVGGVALNGAEKLEAVWCVSALVSRLSLIWAPRVVHGPITTKLFHGRRVGGHMVALGLPSVARPRRRLAEVLNDAKWSSTPCPMRSGIPQCIRQGWLPAFGHGRSPRETREPEVMFFGEPVARPCMDKLVDRCPTPDNTYMRIARYTSAALRVGGWR